MQLFIFVTNKADKIPAVVSGLAKIGVTGASVVNCEGMAHMLANSDVESPPFFNSMRSFFNSDYDQGKMLFAVMGDERVLDSKDVIRGICGNFDEPNTGVVFTVPVMHFEGVTRKKK